MYNCIKLTAKELWKSLDNKYKTKDDGIMRIVGRFLEFIMVDWKAIISQVQEF